MPTLQQLASTIQGRRNLLILHRQMRNEVAFFLCVREYRRRPTKTRAATIHDFFLARDSEFYCEGLIGLIGNAAYRSWLKTNYYPNIVNPLGTAMRMPKVFRKLTAWRRVPPGNLFDIFMNRVRQLLPIVQDEEAFSTMLQASKEGFILMSRGAAGGETFEGRERMGVQRARKWSRDLAGAMKMSKQFDPASLGITNVFSETYLT
jgi:hypothetical protein